MTTAENLARSWRSRLAAECPNYSDTTHDSIIGWLLGENPDRLSSLSSEKLEIVSQAMDYRWRILRLRYLGVAPAVAYSKLMRRLASLVLLRQKIKTWVALSRDRTRTTIDVVQETIQEICERDRYMQQQIAWIGRCTSDHRLRNSLLLATIEEYCLRPVRNQPLLVLRFFNYLRRSQKAGLTQVPNADSLRIVSHEITLEDGAEPVSLLDSEATRLAKESTAWEEQQQLRTAVVQEFEKYLETNLEPIAARWLRLYLQGNSQEAIAQELNLPIKQIYRLREKISYHAIRVFALKQAPELVANWLQISLSENGLGLTQSQWQMFMDSLTPVQREILMKLKAGTPVETIANQMNLKTSQVFSEWTRAFLAAQSQRNSP